MKAWKEALWLARIELSASILNFLLLFVFILFMVSFIVLQISEYLEGGFISFDLFYLLIFTVGPLWAKPKSFQLQKINDGRYASPAVGMLQQLPIEKEIIIKSRFIISFVYTIPVQLTVLLLLYVFSIPIQNMMSLGMYVAFMIVWISFGVYVGGMFPASDVGDKKRSTFYIWGSFIATMIVVIGILMGIQVTFGQGIVSFSIALAQKWPILSTCISIFLAIIGFHYWQFSMNKKMNEVDYF